MVKVVVTNYDFKLKVKDVVGDYSFDHKKKKKFKTVITNYGFITVIILESSLVYSLKKKRVIFLSKL